MPDEDSPPELSSIFDLYPRNSLVWRALYKLTQRPWFSRVWVLQEVAVARRATIVCGREQLCWSVLLQIKSETLLELNRALGHEWSQVWAVEKCRTPDTLPNLLSRTLGSRSSEPRDKIYALVGLIKPQKRARLPFQVDYDISVANLFLDVTRWCVEHAPENLHYYLELAGAGRTVKDLPSWAVDWSISRRSKDLWSSRIDLKQRKSMTNPIFLTSTHGYPMNQLLLHGCQVDSIAHTGVASTIGQAKSGRDTEDSYVAAVRPWQNMVYKIRAWNDSEDVVDIFIRTLCGYMAWRSYLQNFHFNRGCILKICNGLRLDKLKAMVPPEELPLPEFRFRRWRQLLRSSCWNRKMCLTAASRLAMCPVDTKVGDIIVRVGYAEHTYVLRPRGTHYTLIGMSYIHGGYLPSDDVTWFILE